MHRFATARCSPLRLRTAAPLASRRIGELAGATFGCQLTKTKFRNVPRLFILSFCPFVLSRGTNKYKCLRHEGTTPFRGRRKCVRKRTQEASPPASATTSVVGAFRFEPNRSVPVSSPGRGTTSSCKHWNHFSL